MMCACVLVCCLCACFELDVFLCVAWELLVCELVRLYCYRFRLYLCVCVFVCLSACVLVMHMMCFCALAFLSACVRACVLVLVCSRTTITGCAVLVGCLKCCYVPVSLCAFKKRSNTHKRSL